MLKFNVVILTLTIEIELTISGDRSRDHTAMLFDSEQEVFQVNCNNPTQHATYCLL